LYSSESLKNSMLNDHGNHNKNDDNYSNDTTATTTTNNNDSNNSKIYLVFSSFCFWAVYTY